MSNQSTVDHELSLPEMLADPIVRMIMARDGVAEQAIKGLAASVRDRAAARQTEEREFGAAAFDGQRPR